jgi:predicted RNase H-like HicB family nuclease/predicted nucleotidyltransferase
MNVNLKIARPVEDEKHTVDVGGRGYEVILHPDTEEGGCWVECPELSGCMSQGDTLEEALYMIKDAMEGYLAVLRDAEIIDSCDILHGNMPEAIREIIGDILKKLIPEYAPRKVILFGSYADGKYRAESDIDLLIIKNTTENFIERWAGVRRILSDPRRTAAIETFVMTPKEVQERLDRGDQFIAGIIKEGKILYAA